MAYKGSISLQENLPRPLPNHTKELFLKISDHDELADFFGSSYQKLSKLIYGANPAANYRIFTIPKKSGGKRRIASPNFHLKQIQQKLGRVLYEIYPTRACVHGFAIERSIVTNAQQHLRKKYIFNLDLEDFFSSIHFGRVRNLFMSKPFVFSHSVATILAQICCLNNRLPQGAPTSPIISNMIAYKLDSQLMHLAKTHNATYTRYADDISFSFTCTKPNIPIVIMTVQNNQIAPGEVLASIIKANGFFVNHNKVRLSGRSSRMEVTGLTVNEFVNIRRKYIRQICSILHAWEKYGYIAAQAEFYRLNDEKKSSNSLQHFVQGKLSFLRSVRGKEDLIFNKLAKRFNELVDKNNQFKIYEPTDTEQNVYDSLWVIEVCYDDPRTGDAHAEQGTAFSLTDVGIVTCAHAVASIVGKKIYDKIYVFKPCEGKKYPIKVDKICYHRDIAICSFANPVAEEYKSIQSGSYIDEHAILTGYPSYASGHIEPYRTKCSIARQYPQSGVSKFELDTNIGAGNSGGPVVNSRHEVIGIALEGHSSGSTRNGCVCISELQALLESDLYTPD